MYTLVGPLPVHLVFKLTLRVNRGEGDTAQVDWNCVQPLLYEAPCDVAQILDCCYASNAIKTGPQGRNEILAACERNVTTPTGEYSYIRRFTVALKQLVNEAIPFSLFTLHERIKAETQKRNGKLPVYKLIPENSDSITLRPRSLVVDPGERENAFQRGNEFLGWAYAKVPICRGDERRDWKDVGFVKILTVKETVNELQADSQSSIG